MKHLGSWRHLATRFWQTVTASPLRPDEASKVRELLRSDVEQALFFGQADADQRHAFEAARQVARAAPRRLDLIRAALLHDVGKGLASLGVIGRVAASIAHKLGLPTPARWSRYLHHDDLGADALEQAGCEPVIVAFARYHHRARPSVITPNDWTVLEAADGKTPETPGDAIR